MKIAVVKYNAGNVESVRNALRRLQIEPVLTDDAEILAAADKIIFPGVGEASSTMNYLKAKNLDAVIKNLSQPVLGICLGMQLLCAFSEENSTSCCGVFPGRVRKFESETLKIPHIGWNTIYNLKGKIFENVGENAYVYFVHGFFVEENRHTSANCDYVLNFSAAMENKNFHAVQFHPEKSGDAGQKILENFINIKQKND